MGFLYDFIAVIEVTVVTGISLLDALIIVGYIVSIDYLVGKLLRLGCLGVG